MNQRHFVLHLTENEQVFKLMPPPPAKSVNGIWYLRGGSVKKNFPLDAMLS